MARADLSKRAGEVSGMFDQVAKRYDRTNALLSLGNDTLWRVATVKAIAPKPGELLLDLAAGTGTSSATFAKAGADVTAVDFSPGMIEVGEKKHPDIDFVLADVSALPFPDNHFDIVTISFGLRNVEEPKLALAEMFRVLKPGGRLVICEFSTPPRAAFRAAYSTYMRFVMPGVVRLTSSNSEAYDYLNDSIQAWPDQETLSQWIRGAGFTRVAHRNLTLGVVALHRGRKPLSVPKVRRARKAAVSTPVATAPEPTSAPPTASAE